MLSFKSKVPVADKQSTADLFYQVACQLNHLSGVDYISKALDLFKSLYKADYAAVYELVREGKSSYVTIVESGHTKNSQLDGFSINQLDDAQLLNITEENFCNLTIEHQTYDSNQVEDKVNQLTLISMRITDVSENTSGLLLFVFDEQITLVEQNQQIVELFTGRIGAELERFKLQFSLDFVNEETRYIAESSRDMIWHMDCDGYYTYVNRACYDIYGYEANQMIGHHYSEFINKSVTKEFSEFIQQSSHGRSVHKLITQHENKKGSPIKLICTVKPIKNRNGEHIGLTGTSTDITEFIRSQILFKNNNELFSKVLSRLPVIFLRINEDANIIDIRGKGLQRLGVEDMAWVDKSCYGLFKNNQNEINAVLKGGAVSFEVSGTVNDNYWAFFVSMFFDSWTGFGAIGFCVDITEQKQNEIKLEKLLNEKRELNQKLVRIQEDERRNLARELHDELGQSITAVKSLAKAIADFSGNQYSETRSLSNSIVDLSGTLYEVVNDMMRRLRPEILDTLGLVEALKNCIDRSQLEIQGVIVNLTVKGDLLRLDEMISITCYRIVQEALTNISKYAMASNVNITIHRDIIKNQERRQRSISDTKNDPEIISIRDVLFIAIEDDGVGMDIEKATTPSDGRQRMGLKGIEERLVALDAIFEITSKSNKGVKIAAEIEISRHEVVNTEQQQDGINQNVT